MKKPFRPRNASTPVPMSATSNTIFNLQGTTMLRGTSETMMRAYGNMGTVFSTVSLYAQGTSHTDWRLYKKQPKDGRVRYSTNDNGSDQRVEVVNHAALTLINQPNPFFTRMSLFELSQTYLDLTGECYWILDRENAMSLPTAIWVVRPDRMEPIATGGDYLSGYVYTSPDGREKIPLTTDEVIMVKYPNPLEPLHGLGPIQAVLVDVEGFRYSSEWNKNFFLNGATPDGVITVPNNWDDKEFQNFTNRWRETHRGVARAHRVAVLEGGATWTAQNPTARDMDFANLQSNGRDIVREAFRMHKVMIGVSDDVNRANAQTGEEVFSSWGVVPRLDRWKDMFNNTLLPMFGSTGTGVEFDYITPVPPNREQDNEELTAKSAAASVLVNAGYDPHDVLEVVGLPDMDVVEKATQAPALPPGWVPGMAPPAPGAESEPPETPSPPPAPDSGEELSNRLLKMLSNGHIPVEIGRR